MVVAVVRAADWDKTKATASQMGQDMVRVAARVKDKDERNREV